MASQPLPASLLLCRPAHRPHTQLLSLDILETAIRLRPTHSDKKLARRGVFLVLFFLAVLDDFSKMRHLAGGGAEAAMQVFFFFSFLVSF